MVLTFKLTFLYYRMKYMNVNVKISGNIKV